MHHPMQHSLNSSKEQDSVCRLHILVHLPYFGSVLQEVRLPVDKS